MDPGAQPPTGRPGTLAAAAPAGRAPEEATFLLNQTAGVRERRRAVAAVAVSVVLFGLCAPFARRPLAPLPAFVPLYESALLINDVITAVLLFGQYRILRSRALMVLACAYLFTALMVLRHALSFPGVFAPAGLLGAGPQTTPALSPGMPAFRFSCSPMPG